MSKYFNSLVCKVHLGYILFSSCAFYLFFVVVVVVVVVMFILLHINLQRQYFDECGQLVLASLLIVLCKLSAKKQEQESCYFLFCFDFFRGCVVLFWLFFGLFFFFFFWGGGLFEGVVFSLLFCSFLGFCFCLFACCCCCLFCFVYIFCWFFCCCFLFCFVVFFVLFCLFVFCVLIGFFCFFCFLLFCLPRDSKGYLTVKGGGGGGGGGGFYWVYLNLIFIPLKYIV